MVVSFIFIRDPLRNSRFEVFSIRPFVTIYPKFETGKMFGFNAISDKYGFTEMHYMLIKDTVDVAV